MTASLPAIEAWIRVVGLALGAAVVLIVPVTGFMKEYWAYRARIRESATLRVDAARSIPGPLLGHVLEVTDLAQATVELGQATRDLTAALREARDRARPGGRASPGGRAEREAAE